MIVWLASFPRSGNTLVRTILKSCFGLPSFDPEVTAAQPAGDYITETIGHQDLQESWARFYDGASQSGERFFVKTHRPPPDDQPCIYIVRDGRKATLSYFYHYRRFFPGENRSLLELVVGYDFYGDWTSHYWEWQPHARPLTLLVRYESLVNDPEGEIRRMADFLGFEKPLRPWENPFRRLQHLDSDFFRRGTASWEPDPQWTPQIDNVFRARHGELMRRLHYPDPDPATAFGPSAVDTYAAFIQQIVSFAERAKMDQFLWDQRGAAMQMEISRLSSEAQQRLTLLEELTAVADERLAEIERLAAEAEKRRMLIQKLHREAQRMNPLSASVFPQAFGKV